ncbi:iron-sulfur cluster repair di-iron protein [Shewanella sp.]|uniref:iron-sulfur cluster repair di-iron protein n=1 Tax=Shewanella sp. TaxID=50422 RepID=UPI003566A42D
MTNTLLDTRVGELVVQDYRFAHVFSRFGIDFCCGGGRTLSEACERAGADADEVVSALQHSAAEGEPDAVLAGLALPALLDYIEATHHSYVRTTAPLLLEYAAKMVRAHGEHYSEIKPLAGWIQALVEDLLPHLMKEEQILFPAIRAMAGGEQVNGCFGHIGNPIRAMEYEHDEAGTILKRLRELTQDYQPPAHACTTWRICYQTLAEFEADLHRHIHLENNLLFPKTLELARG